MKNILITGGLGYIGSSLMKQLEFNNVNKIVIVDLDLFHTEEKLKNLFKKKNAESKVIVKKINFVNTFALDKIFKEHKINIVIHLGGLVGDPACAFNIQLTKKINTIATNELVDLSVKHGVVKFIYASTCSVYGINEKLCSENTEPKPISEYARSKLEGEIKLHSVKDKLDEIIILRFSTLYGVSERIRFDLVANLFYAKAKWEKSISIFGGWQWRPFISVKDAGLVLSNLLNINIVGINTYNVGLDEGNSTLENLAQLIKSKFKDCEIIDTGAKDDARNYKVNFDKFYDKFGGALKFDLKNGIDDLCSDLDQFEDNWKASKYSNLQTTKNNFKILISDDN